MTKIFIPEELDQSAINRIEDIAVVTRNPEDREDAVGIVVRSYYVDADSLKAMPKLEFVVKHGAGLDRIDADLLDEEGISWTSTPGHNANGVSELAVLHAMTALRYNLTPGSVGKGRETHGKRVGIVGYGRIGKRVSHIMLSGFRNEVQAFDPVGIFDDDVKACQTVEEAASGVDVLFITCPLTPQTRHLINSAVLAGLNNNAIVVNTGRGGVVDNVAIQAAMESGHVLSYAHDFEGEPDAYSNDAFAERIVSTPHVGGATEEALRDTGLAVAEAVAKAIDS